jgi:predicted hydrocarbon binding protein
MVYLMIPSELGERVVGFEFTLSNVSTTLKRITSIISEYNLDIYHIETCYKSRDEYRIFIAIDFTDKDISTEKLLEEFEKQENVKNVVVSPRVKNIIYPSKFCSIDLGSIRGIIIGKANMEGIIEGIKEEFGEEVGNTFLFRMGHEIGRKAYKLFAEKLGIHSFDESMEVIKALARGAGWCDIKEVIRRDDKIIIRVEHLWECELQKGKTDKPASHLVRGIYVGLLKEFLKKDLKSRETKCIALGDPYCEFEITVS